MASDSSSGSVGEKEILINKDDALEKQDERALSTENAKGQSKLILYHWTQSFSSQKVRLAIAEKGLKCEEYDVSLPLSEHNEPWFMRLNPAGEVPVLVNEGNVICDPTQIMDYLEQNFRDVSMAPYYVHPACCRTVDKTSIGNAKADARGGKYVLS
ncbi:hypothetical protein GJAV_G00078740 [Gymnothorax javanicus]|nr:hypothetical protein GJAV_G00078740 [Gymnothorax javanicus]